jgi:hypothetical protein
MAIFLAALIVLLQVVTGSLIILKTPLASSRSKFEILGLGLALGTFLSMLSASLFLTTPLAPFAWAIPSLLVIVFSIITIRQVRKELGNLTLPRPEVAAVVIGLIVGSSLLAINWIRAPLSSIRAGGSVDMYFFEALSRGISQFGPAESILMSGGSLRYHWFTYGWAGQLTEAADLPSFVALTRILPIVSMIGVILLSASWAKSMKIGNTRSPSWVPSLAVLLIVFAGYSGALYGGILNFDSPSQSTTTVWLLALVIVFLRGLTTIGENQSSFQGQHVRTRLISALFVFAFAVATTGGKASHAIVALGGFAFIALMGIALRAPWRNQGILLFLAALVGVTLTFIIVLSGVGVEQNLTEEISVRASTWQGLDPLTGRWGPLFGTFALILAVLARLSGAMWLVTDRKARRSPELFFASGAVAVGFLALLALRGGINELWFLLAASAPVAVISAYGVGQAQSWLHFHSGKTKVLWTTFAIAMAASMVSLILSRNWVFASSPIEFFQWPGLLFWLAILLIWLLIPLMACIFWRATRSEIPAISAPAWRWVLAVTASSLVFTSILTRPAVIWTESRTLTTEAGLLQPSAPVEILREQSTERQGGSDPLSERFAAAQWLNDSTSIEDIVITSLPYSSFIPAFTGHRMYLAGQEYQFGLGPVSQHPEIERRAELSRNLGSSLNSDLAQNLCQEGVSYAWVEGGRFGSGLEPTISFGNVALFDLRPRCS